ncbi:hypothetical protein evm_004967 [Chilo suppressalis]|nr:hypothetical protein evm_004967 [Chilo suppressalis]
MSWLETRIKWPECESVNLSEIFEEAEKDSGQSAPSSANNKKKQLFYPLHLLRRRLLTWALLQTSRKPFEDLENKQKKRRSGTILDYPEEELTFAFITKLKCNGKEVFARIIDHLMKKPEKVGVVESFLFMNEKKETMQEDQVLTLTTSLDLSKWMYLTLRSALSQQLKLPSYHKLLEAKKRCFPNARDIIISEDGAKVKLQALLDVTTRRLLQVVGDDLNISSGSLKQTSKWGFDVFSAQSNYKQRSEMAEFDDSSVFMTSLVPLKLEAENIVIWDNPKPSSTFYCRPIKFQFAKETTDLVKQEQAAMEEERQKDNGQNAPSSANNVISILSPLHTKIGGGVGPRWRRWLARSVAIVEVKQLPQWSVIGWVTKNIYLEFLRASEGTLSRWSRLHLQSLAPANPHWARVVVWALFPLPSLKRENLTINKKIAVPMSFCNPA